MSFNAIRENELSQKKSESTVSITLNISIGLIALNLATYTDVTMECYCHISLIYLF